MDGSMDGWIDGWMHGCIDGCMDEWMDAWMGRADCLSVRLSFCLSFCLYCIITYAGARLSSTPLHIENCYRTGSELFINKMAEKQISLDHCFGV